MIKQEQFENELGEKGVKCGSFKWRKESVSDVLLKSELQKYAIIVRSK